MNNSDLQVRKTNAIARGQGNLNPFYVEKAKNSELWDVEGNRYIDFGAGIAVVNTGHCHPEVSAAVTKQVENFSHTCVMVTPYENAVELAEKLNDLAPIDNAKTVFVTTGAEAIENTIKIARAHTGRPGVIAFHGGFHGRTNMCMGLTGKVVPYKQDFGPFPSDIFHAPFPIDYHGISVADSLKALATIFKTNIQPDKVAAIILEPVQGEGGFYPAPEGFMSELRKICDQHGILLIADEIQTGFARTGKMFATQYHDVEPDLITMAKGMAGGYPLACVVGKAEIMDAPMPGGLGGTYGASPIACAAALSVIDIIEKEDLINQANKIGETVVKKLEKMQQEHPQIIGDVRNTGAMIAFELIKDGDVNQPNTELTSSLVAAAGKNGLILLSCGIRSNVIRILTPLTIEDDILAEGLEILEKSFNALV